MDLYAKTKLEGATITGDALNCNKPQAHAILKADGDYFLQLKDENRHPFKAADRIAQGGSSFLPTPKEEPDTTQARVDERTISVYPLETLEANLPGACSLAVMRRTRTGDPDEVPTTAFYITSHPPEKGCAPEFASLARGHWGGCEIRNHWVRDHCMREDDIRSKNCNLNCALAGLRVCLITIKSILYPDQSWPSLQEKCQRDPSIAFRAIAKLRGK